MHLDKIQMLKIFSSDNINVTINALFFLIGAPTHNSLTFNFAIRYEFEPIVHLYKAVCGIFHF